MKRQVAIMGGYCRETRGECDAIFHCKMFFCAFAEEVTVMQVAMKEDTCRVERT